MFLPFWIFWIQSTKRMLPDGVYYLGWLARLRLPRVSVRWLRGQQKDPSEFLKDSRFSYEQRNNKRLHQLTAVEGVVQERARGKLVDALLGDNGIKHTRPHTIQLTSTGNPWPTISFTIRYLSSRDVGDVESSCIDKIAGSGWIDECNPLLRYS